ncbi:DUF2240 family protein [Thermogymnomonas acidicola]|uniref:DUF2240 family protein n=1 Tax=Thermogymnomonas acidicola TaxID=399579 RepID=UPI0009466177|nr:DUF2240 family protein [Thermogymnomonas acidicola]
MARKLIAITANSKRDQKSFVQQDFVNVLSFKRALLSPDDVRRFVSESVREGLLVERDGRLLPNFSTGGVIVPLDFSVKPEELFATSTDRPLVDRLLDEAVASGKFTKRQAIERAKQVQGNLKYVSFEMALMAALSDEGIDVRQYAREVLESMRKG